MATAFLRAPASRPLVQVEHVSHRYGRGDGGAAVLDDVSLTLHEDEVVGLLGRSGSGKSTLLRSIAGLIRPDEGRVHFADVPDGPAHTISMVFQTFALFPWLTVLQNVELGLEAQRVPADERRTRALAAIDLIGLDGFENAYPKELSGGMRQRVGLARAIVVNPSLLLMDEPFSALDALTRGTLQDEVRRICLETGQTAFMITHDVDEAIYLADRIVLMTNGPHAMIAEIVENPLPRDRIRAEVHHHADYYAIRNHLIDFLVVRSKTFRDAIPEGYDRRHPPVVRPTAGGSGPDAGRKAA